MVKLSATLRRLIRRGWNVSKKEDFITIKAEQHQIDAVLDFFCNHRDFRTLSSCAKHTGLDIELCKHIKHHLYLQRKLGLYYFEAGVPPQKYMRQYILNNFPEITADSYILEVGPGENPMFPIAEYQNWYGVDKYLQDGMIDFKEQAWAKDLYPVDRILKGGWENLSDACASVGVKDSFDIVVGSHSYEHVFKPIQSLIEANRMLKPGGILVLFVPDGLTDDINTKDPTHTLYIVPEMMEEFFQCAGGFKDILIKPFRPNADLVITAVKI